MKIRNNSYNYIRFELESNDYIQKGRYLIKFFLNEFKQKIPAGKRHWIEKESYWLVHKNYQDILNQLIEKYFHQQQGSLNLNDHIPTH